jgi:hypothetical protein
MKRGRKRSGKSDLIQSCAEEDQMDVSQRYIANGRRFQSLDMAEVVAIWVSAYQNWADDIKNRAAFLNIEDAQAEMRLRSFERPDDLIEASHRTILSKLAELNDPEGDDRVAERISEILRGRERATHH